MIRPKRLAWVLPLVAAIAIWLAIRPTTDGVTRLIDGLTYASGDLARDLDGTGAGAGTRIARRFALPDGTPCSIFARRELSGIACRETEGWHLRVTRDGVSIDDPASTSKADRALSNAAESMAAR